MNIWEDSNNTEKSITVIKITDEYNTISVSNSTEEEPKKVTFMVGEKPIIILKKKCRNF